MQKLWWEVCGQAQTGYTVSHVQTGLIWPVGHFSPFRACCPVWLQACYHPKRSILSFLKVGPAKPFVKMSVIWSLVSIGFTTKSFGVEEVFETCSLIQWYLHAKCLECGVVLGRGIFASLRAPSLSSQIEEYIGVVSSNGRFTSNSISLSKCWSGSCSLHEIDRAMYSASIVLSAVAVCNLLPHDTEQLLSVIIYPVRDLTQCGSSLWSTLKIPAKSASE